MTLAIVAGRGDLPASVARAAATPPLVCGYEGITLSGIEADLTFRLETLGSLLLELGTRGVTQVCFAGGLDRPALDPSKLDAETAPLVPMFMQALQSGDDGALRVVVDLFEKTGFQVLGAHEIAPDLLAKGGVYGEHWPDAQMRSDADVAAAHILAMSPQDIGQACVVGAERVLGMEDARGTDDMLARLPSGASAKHAILFKGPKQGQSRQIDLPTVGPETLNAAHAAGLAGVVVDAGDVLVLDAARCAALADEHGLVFWARTGE
ncbi:UDP-2,3-diacylglucosamine diphosphatase LpxI [uncultured Sulfitobacter sp.]|uniref:LpxI family protein n=1 Tax=uncultured Sulfitobacter sp. TaxID=191468 RepID=UPI00260B3891|nr:UDP-2,3-diacylglucosamine diphosphatase LpxI [uncultured Sulfitobacter sp.]